MEYPTQCTGTANAFIEAYGRADAIKILQDKIDMLRIFHELGDVGTDLKLMLACHNCIDCSDRQGLNDEVIRIPKISNIHQKVLEAVEGGKKLQMEAWHAPKSYQHHYNQDLMDNHF